MSLNKFGIDRARFKYELMQLHNQGTVLVLSWVITCVFSKDDKTIPDIKTMLGIDQALRKEMASRKEAKFSSDGTAAVKRIFQFNDELFPEHNVENNLTLQNKDRVSRCKNNSFISIENSNDWNMES